MFAQLIANFAIVGLIVAVWINIQDWAVAQRWYRAFIVLGTMMGIAAVVSVFISVQVNGYLIDLRAVPVAIAALLGGWVGGVIAMALAIIARLIAGGPGAPAGSVAISLAMVAGLLGFGLLRLRRGYLIAIASAAIATGLSTLVLLPFVNIETRGAILTSLAVSGPLNAAGVVALGYAIIRSRDRARQRALLFGAVEQAPDFFYVKDTHSRIVAANRNVAQIHGFERAQQLRRLTDLDLEPSERASELLAEEHQILAARAPLVDKAEDVVGKDGTRRSFVTSKSPVYAGRGNLVGLVGVTKDVTVVKELQHALEDSRNELNFILEEMSDGVALVDAGGYIVMANDRYRELFPRTGHLRVAGAFLPTVLQAVLDTDEQPSATSSDHRQWMNEVMTTLREGGDDLVQLFDGRWLRLRTRSNERGSAIMVVSDITKIKRAEIDLLAMTKKLELLSITDGLTQLLNRRGFDEALKKEFSRARRTDRPLSVILLDVDRFKAFNDRYGHLEGDECLRRVASAVSRAVNRPGDLVARYGGEEITVILPETTAQGAYTVAENIRHEIRGLAITHEGSEKGIVTASMGLAVLDPLDASMSDTLLVARADEALYLAKSGGRDKVIAWSDPAMVGVAPVAYGAKG